MAPSLLAILSLISIASATSFMEEAFDETVGKTPVLVRGTVGRSEVQRLPLPDGSNPPFTYWDMKVTEVFKGDLKPKQIRIRQLGGEIEGGGMSISGAADFSAGEEVVLTLEDLQQDGSFPLRGLGTGKYIIERDADGKEYLIGSGLPADSNGNHRMAIEKVREMVKSQPDIKATPATEVKEPGLLEQASRPASSEFKPQEFAEEPTAPQKGARIQLWVLMLGMALGIGFYLRKTRK